MHFGIFNAQEIQGLEPRVTKNCSLPVASSSCLKDPFRAKGLPQLLSHLLLLVTFVFGRGARDKACTGLDLGILTLGSTCLSLLRNHPELPRLVDA